MYNLLVHTLTEALLAGPWTHAEMLARMTAALGQRWVPLRSLVLRLRRHFGVHRAPITRALGRFLDRDRRLRDAWKRRHQGVGAGTTPLVMRPPLRGMLGLVGPSFRPAPGAPARDDIPPITTVDELTRWLALAEDQLYWMADLEGRQRRFAAGKLVHYRTTLVPKRSGGVRLIEAPKATLCAAQRRILHGLLDHVPVHDAAQGFVRHRSVHTHASMHVGKAVVIRLDLEDFFLSIRAARVRAIFDTLGYPPAIADLLTGLCTHRTPDAAWNRAPRPQSLDEIESRFAAKQRARDAHLPQGAPTSPALANLCAFRLDMRLSKLAATVGATYSRYADDLTFSGDAHVARRADSLVRRVTTIARSEGFAIRAPKTRIQRASTRQEVTGIVVNERPNLRRADVDRLKAILHACVTKEPRDQDRSGVGDLRAHLEGRIAWVTSVNRERGQKLRAMFDKIGWS